MLQFTGWPFTRKQLRMRLSVTSLRKRIRINNKLRALQTEPKRRKRDERKVLNLLTANLANRDNSSHKQTIQPSSKKAMTRTGSKLRMNK